MQHQQRLLRPRATVVQSSGHYSALPRIRLIHRRDFACDGSPLHLTAERAATALALELFPLEEFVSEEKLLGLAKDDASSQATYENLR